MKFLKLFLMTFVLLFCHTVFAEESAANALSQLLGNYKTFKANFSQRTYSSTNSNMPAQKSTGRVYLQRPGKFRWEVKTPMQQIIIANGSTLWIYDVELQQATQQKLDATQTSNPAVFLSGDTSELMKQYIVTKVSFRGKTWYQLKPRQSQANFVLVRMFFSKNQLSAVWVKNNLDQISLFEFSNIQLNVPLSEKLFIFKAPPGVEILK